MASGDCGHLRNQQRRRDWKTLWKTQVLGKIRMFLWRLAKQSLPTEDVRAHRHMSTTSSCGFCGSPDSWRHSLLECTASRCSWALVDDELGQSLVATTEPNAKQWLFSLLNSLSHDQFIKLAVTLGYLVVKAKGNPRRDFQIPSGFAFFC